MYTDEASISNGQTVAGITRRDLLAAHAPPTPVWYEPDTSHAPRPADPSQELLKDCPSGDAGRWFKNWLDHSIKDERDPQPMGNSQEVRNLAGRASADERAKASWMAAASATMCIHILELREWTQRVYMPALLQWPYAYADIVLRWDADRALREGE